MFEYFPLSCAVENIKPFLDELKALPAYVTKGKGGEGFSMAINRLMELRT
jgi:hydroxymethylpyrimidine pyrophosphatase-like HAD family hydrolase